MPYSSVVLPPDRRRQWMHAFAAANVALGLLWTWRFPFANQGGADPWRVASVTVAFAALSWCVATIRGDGLSLGTRIRIVLAGTSALALWIPLPVVTVVAFMLGAHLFVLFPVFMAVIALIIWAATCATWYLARYALGALLSIEGAERGSI